MAHVLKTPVVTCPFRYKSQKKKSPWAAGYHPGVDFKANVGTTVYAPAAAKIIFSGWGGNKGGWGSAFGYMVIGESKGSDGKKYRWATCHHKTGGLKVKTGQSVKIGQVLGLSGATGNTFGEHVHLEVRNGGYGYWDHVNPSVILNVKAPASAKPKVTTTVIDETYTVRVSALNGRDFPSVDHGVVKATRKKGHTLKVSRKATVAKMVWVKASDGYWYARDHLVLKPVAQAKSVTLNVGTLNVIRHRLGTSNPRGVGDMKKGLPYEKRVSILAKVRNEMAVSILGTQEAGTYADGELLEKAFGKGWDHRLHGDNGDLTNAIYTHEKRKQIRGGKIELPGTHHNWATWKLERDVKTGIEFYVFDTHLDHRKEENTLRGKQATSLFEQALKISKGLPVIWIGDFNRDKDDKPDTVGAAAKKLGLLEAEVSSTAKEASASAGTLNGLVEKLREGRKLDRIFVTSDIKMSRYRVILGAPGSDHNGVAVQVVIPRKKAAA